MAAATTTVASAIGPEKFNHPVRPKDRKTPPPETAASCQPGGRRIFPTDQVTKRHFLIDCGSDICNYPITFLRDKRPCTSFELGAANHSSIKTYVLLCPNVQPKHLRREFMCNFAIVDVAEPILGSELFTYYNLLPGCQHDQLIGATKDLSSPGQRMTTQQPSIKVPSGSQPVPWPG
ncbi:hypothetical protein HPB48_007998 [Haemaphysalis longicornis]|uniref:Uncharacterized protein n=1 Tax=Haemaphysalis longicornis TaxID=44386 RepID=A0A9J6GV34_HAELO|nr:hypothetical protein HPB48_007998 [Haemaphysalis longicornis]